MAAEGAGPTIYILVLLYICPRTTIYVLYILDVSSFYEASGPGVGDGTDAASASVATTPSQDGDGNGSTNGVDGVGEACRRAASMRP